VRPARQLDALNHFVLEHVIVGVGLFMMDRPLSVVGRSRILPLLLAWRNCFTTQDAAHSCATSSRTTRICPLSQQSGLLSIRKTYCDCYAMFQHELVDNVKPPHGPDKYYSSGWGLKLRQTKAEPRMRTEWFSL